MKRVFFLLVVALISAQCSDEGDRVADPGTGEFGIFLTQGEVPPERLVVLSYIEPAGEPVLSQDDIIAYFQDEHDLVLAPGGKSKLDTLQVPVHGRSFVVCVGRQVVYAGAFWTVFSSVSFDGPAIVLPAQSDTVRIQMGYPERNVCLCSDPRAQGEVLGTLEAAGKLR